MMESEKLDVNRGRAAAQPGESGCERAFPARFFAAVFHPDGEPTPGTPPPGAGIGDPARQRSGRTGDTANLTGVAASRIEALEEAYDRHGDALYRLALLITGRQKAAEDAVVDAFSVWWQAPGNVDPWEPSLRSALAGAVYSRCLDAPTARNRRRQGAPGLGALAALPRMQRDLLALVWFGEHTRRQAAARVGVSDDAAASMLTHALSAVGGLDLTKRGGTATRVAAAPRTSLGLLSRTGALGVLQRRYRTSSPEVSPRVE